MVIKYHTGFKPVSVLGLGEGADKKASLHKRKALEQSLGKNHSNSKCLLLGKPLVRATGPNEF